MVTRETSVSAGLASLGVLAGLAEPDSAVERLERLAEILEREAIPRGFLGPSEGPKMAARHVLEAAALATVLQPTGTLIDVGSGAGLPGIVLAGLWRDGEIVLIEPQARRAAFLRRLVSELGLGRCSVRQSTAEEAARSDLREAADAVVARAVALPPVALELTLPLARVGGDVAIPVGHPREAAGGREESTGPTEPFREAGPDEAAVGPVAELLGGGHPALRRFEVPGAPGARWVMLVRKLRSTPDRYPRRPGVPRRRPLDGGGA